MMNDIEALKDTSWLADISGMSISAIQKRRCKGNKGLPPFLKIGRKVMYMQTTVSEWMVNQQQG
ncbi:MAG: hypothetical protein V7731_18215 [Amphritea sp.]